MSKTQITAEPGLPFIDITREVDAPRDLVFRAFTDPELVSQWLGPRRYRMTIDEWNVRDGGRWRYVHSDDESSHGFHGVFHGTPSPDNMVQTFEYEGAPGHVSLDTLVLEERDGRTTIRTHSVFQSVEARDAMVAAGMAGGVEEGYERLDELVGRLVAVA
jgi:uncharacterized protein YndB with AHSA1/START domain